MEELDEAVTYLTAVVESPPPPLDSADIWIEIGCIRQEQREEELAREAFARALDNGADVTQAEYWHDLALKLEQVVVVPEHTRGTAGAGRKLLPRHMCSCYLCSQHLHPTLSPASLAPGPPTQAACGCPRRNRRRLMTAVCCSRADRRPPRRGRNP